MGKQYKMLDVFCGLGGVSDGFAAEGFDVLGIDIEDMPTKGYKHKFLKADIRDLKGEDFKGYDVIWGSPPCRDFCLFAKRFGKTWKANPPNPEEGLKLVNSFIRFVDAAQPKYWIMENVPYLRDYLKIPYRFKTSLRSSDKFKNKNQMMVRAFWGSFPATLISKENKNVTMRPRAELRLKRRPEDYKYLTSSLERAKIPLACSQSFARAIKAELDKTGEGKNDGQV